MKNWFEKLLAFLLIASMSGFVMGCGDEEPPRELPEQPQGEAEELPGETEQDTEDADEDEGEDEESPAPIAPAE